MWNVVLIIVLISLIPALFVYIAAIVFAKQVEKFTKEENYEGICPVCKKDLITGESLFHEKLYRNSTKKLYGHFSCWEKIVRRDERWIWLNYLAVPGALFLAYFHIINKKPITDFSEIISHYIYILLMLLLYPIIAISRIKEVKNNRKNLESQRGKMFWGDI